MHTIFSRFEIRTYLENLTLSGTDCFRKILTRESVNFCWESVDLGEVLDATVRPLCGWRGLEPSSSIAPGSWPREAAVMLKRSGAASTRGWASTWAQLLQRSRCDAAVAAWSPCYQNPRCCRVLWLGVADMGRLSGMALESSADSVVVESCT